MMPMNFPTSQQGLLDAGYTPTGEGHCRACGAAIDWWKTPNGKVIPLDFATATPHWSTCPKADDSRKAR